jgi:hypothetical protein
MTASRRPVANVARVDDQHDTTSQHPGRRPGVERHLAISPDRRTVDGLSELSVRTDRL